MAGSDTNDDASDASADAEYTADERAAMRAFLQRAEVRLSTMHRVATALLSGAGILVLLPALERDSVVQVLRTLLVGPISWSRGLLAIGVTSAVLLALVAFWLLVLELTRFYFHSNHIRNDDGEFFTPRFTLTGIRLPTDELSPRTDQSFEAMHGSPDNVELLVAKNAVARERIDRQLDAYPGLVQPDAADPDRARADALFELAASRRRTLAEEVAKVEYGIVRHAIRLQVIVLRYVKALLVIVATALASFACAAAVSDHARIGAPDERWIAGVLLLWAPVVVLVVGAPVRWLERLLKADGARHTALGADRELTQVEDVTARIAAGTWAVATVAAITLLVDHPISTQGRTATVVMIVGSAIAMGLHGLRRLTRRRQQVGIHP
jgi:hypothetical protein